MLRSTATAVAFVLATSAAVAADEGPTYCGTPGLPTVLADSFQTRLEHPSKRWDGNTLVVPVAVHLILNGRTGDFSSDAVLTLIDNLNWAFDGSGIQFELIRLDRTKNKGWHLNCLKNEAKMKKKLAFYPAQVLNVYTCNMPGIIPGTTTLGIATQPFGNFPQYRSYPENHYMQGIIVSPKTMPVSSNPPDYYYGLTTAHEVGHWFGLFHTFHPGTFGLPSGCSEPGDYVADTPVQDLPSGSCMQYDTCGDPGIDDYTNFMDYRPDQCAEHFTSGQVGRMQSVILELRPTLAQ